MKKYLFIIFLLLLLIFYSYTYLTNLQNNKEAFIFNVENKAFIYQKKDIELNNLDEFIFDEYFKILSFNEESYTYDFIDNNIEIKLKSINEKFIFPYKIIEPTIIEKTIYQTNTEYIYIEDDNSYIEEYDDDTYIICDYFSFACNTDISSIINEVGSNALYSSSSITCDYSKLNPNQIGEYSVYLYCENETFEIIVEIY